MRKYYGITTPTDDFIAHWGIKGMKWGVRKARPVSNGAPKSLGYRRAERKLAKLEAKANRNVLLAKANRLDKVSKGARIAGRVGLGAAAAGTAGSVGSGHLIRAASGTFNKQLQNYAVGQRRSPIQGPVQTGKEMVTYYDGGAHKVLSDQTKARQNIYDKAGKVSRYVQAGGAGLAALGYGAAIGSKLRANALRKTANNSAKMAAARAKANAFRKQMNAKYGVRLSSKRRK